MTSTSDSVARRMRWSGIGFSLGGQRREVEGVDLGDAALVAEGGDTGGVESEVDAGGGWQGEPGGDQDAAEVAVADQDHVAGDGPDPVEDLRGAGADLVGGLAVRARVGPDRPLWNGFA